MTLDLADMRQRLAALSPREHWLALAGLSLIAAYAGYSLLWQPLIDSNALLQQTLQSKRQNYQHLQQVAGEVAALGGEAAIVSNDEATELPATVLEQSSSQLQLTTAIKLIQPESERQFAVLLERAPFDPLIVWLTTLVGQHRARVLSVDLHLHGAGQSGLVDGKLVLGF